MEPELKLVMEILDGKRKELSSEIGGLTSLAEDVCLEKQVDLIDELKEAFQKAFAFIDEIKRKQREGLCEIHGCEELGIIGLGGRRLCSKHMVELVKKTRVQKG